MATCVFACIGRTSLIARIEGISINGIEDKKDGLKVSAELRGCCDAMMWMTFLKVAWLILCPIER